MHARLGEILYRSSLADPASDDPDSQTLLIEALGRFSRSVELCDGYIRGWCGIKMVTLFPITRLGRLFLMRVDFQTSDKLLERQAKTGLTSKPTLSSPATTLAELNKRARALLSSTVAEARAGFSDHDIAAAKRIMEPQT